MNFIVILHEDTIFVISVNRQVPVYQIPKQLYEPNFNIALTSKALKNKIHHLKTGKRKTRQTGAWKKF